MCFIIEQVNEINSIGDAYPLKDFFIYWKSYLHNVIEPFSHWLYKSYYTWGKFTVKLEPSNGYHSPPCLMIKDRI